jgi:hypothetical protein
MPIQECSRDGKPGYQWGESGKCYTYASGNEEARKEAKRKAYIQGYAIGELTEMEIQEWIPIETELATIVDVPIIHAGTFYPHNSDMPFEVSEADLDDIVEGSNELQWIIVGAIDTGSYEGNEEITNRLSKPIPGQLNIKHQKPFASEELSTNFNNWIKDAVEGVTVSFQKKLIDGKNWVVKRFHNVRNDVAQTLQEQFPLRSSEFIPLTDPNTGKFYSKVERSTAFLDILTPPAVGGQRPELVVEFMGTEKEPLTIITTGVNIMPKETQNEKTVDVSELQKMQETLAAQNEAIAELQAKIAKTEEDREKAIELAKQQEAENQKLSHDVVELKSDNLMKELNRLRTRKNGLTYQVKPAYVDIVRPIIEGNGVIELAEGQSQQDAMFKLFDEIAEMGDVTLQLSLEGEKSYSQPDQKPDKQAMIQELMEKEGISENEAWIKVTEILGEYKVEA